MCCARLARKNDHDLFARFVSGFYKATNSETAAVHYFEKTDLIQTLLDSLNLENKHCQTLIGQGTRFLRNVSPKGTLSDGLQYFRVDLDSFRTNSGFSRQRFKDMNLLF